MFIPSKRLSMDSISHLPPSQLQLTNPNIPLQHLQIPPNSLPIANTTPTSPFKQTRPRNKPNHRSQRTDNRSRPPPSPIRKPAEPQTSKLCSQMSEAINESPSNQGNPCGRSRQEYMHEKKRAEGSGLCRY